jgi:hypothetical protein
VGKNDVVWEQANNTGAPPNPKSEKAKQLCTNTKYYFFSLKLTSLTQISP